MTPPSLPFPHLLERRLKTHAPRLFLFFWENTMDQNGLSRFINKNLMKTFQNTYMNLRSPQVQSKSAHAGAGRTERNHMKLGTSFYTLDQMSLYLNALHDDPSQRILGQTFPWFGNRDLHLFPDQWKTQWIILLINDNRHHNSMGPNSLIKRKFYQPYKAENQ